MYLYMHIFNITSENISRSLIGFNCEKQKKVNFSVITQKGERERYRGREIESLSRSGQAECMQQEVLAADSGQARTREPGSQRPGRMHATLN